MYLKNKKLKILRLKKCKQQKEKHVWYADTFPVLHTHSKMSNFLTNDKPVIKIM